MGWGKLYESHPRASTLLTHSSRWKYQRKEKMFLHKRYFSIFLHKGPQGSTHTMVWAGRAVFPTCSLPITNSSAASTECDPGQRAADCLTTLLSAVISVVLLYTVLVLALSVPAGITAWKESGGTQNVLTTENWGVVLIIENMRVYENC